MAAILAFVPEGQAVAVPPSAGPIGVAAVVIAYQTIFGAYSGWNNAGYFAGESLDPGRNVPRGMC